MTNQMMQELDGMNKYMQGVKVPEMSSNAQMKDPSLSYTLKDLRQDNQEMNGKKES